MVAMTVPRHPTDPAVPYLVVIRRDPEGAAVQDPESAH